MTERTEHLPLLQTPAPPQGRQQEKSAEARRRICEATLACLAEYGYQGTSTTRIVQQAGISRGAMQHHFPTKHEVIVATAGHLIRQVIGAAERKARRLQAGPEGFRAFIEYLWARLFDTQQYDAVLELMLAARTDEALRAQLLPTLAQTNTLIEERLSALAHGADGEDPALLLAMTRFMLRGLALELESGPEARARAKAVLDRWITLVSPHLNFHGEGGAPSTPT
ncbi:MAG: TetR/AcrR family transcriptional regulator [Bradymonadia bacterium]